jgi:hypothetical protein
VRKIGAERVGVRVCQAVLSLGWLAGRLVGPFGCGLDP